jgi:uncharacterized delta-60 repeat protein
MSAILSIALQKDNKIVAVANNSLTRFLPNGMPDASFGTGGITVPDIAANGMAIQEDGKILVAGSVPAVFLDLNFRQFALARYTEAGVLDPSFGTNGIYITKTTSPVYNSTLNSIVLGPDRIYAFGYSQYLFDPPIIEGLIAAYKLESTPTATTYYKDWDGDGWGRNDDTQTGTTAPSGYVTRSGDCADWDASTYPGAPETFNWKDDDCDGIVDEGPGTGPLNTYYKDWDGDGYGRADDTKTATVAPPGYVAVSGDCADWDATIHPNATETFNYKDDDCDGIIDEGSGTGPLNRYYKDWDGDRYGRNDDTKMATMPPPGYVLLSGDCADWDASIYPGATEVFNWKDDDCDGLIDEGTIRLATTAGNKEQTNVQEIARGFNITASPNPGYQFRVLLQGNNPDEKITIRVVDNIGRLVELRNNIYTGQTLTLGSKYRPGIYFIEAVQGENRRTIKIIKL